MDWQNILPASAAATQRQASSTYTANPSSSYFLPHESDTQHPFNPSSATAEPWNEENHNPEIFSGTLPFGFTQSNYPDDNSRIPLLPDLGTDGTASSVPMHPCQQPYRLGVPGPPLPIPNTIDNPAVDTFMDDTSRTAEKQLMGSLNNGNKPPPASRPNPSCDSTAQKYQQRGRNSPIRSQSMMDQQQEPGSAAHGHSSAANPEAPERTMSFPPSDPTPPSITPSNKSDDLRHVSIDATCTAEQLGNIMQSVAGLANSVTVKVKSRSAATGSPPR